ncbi:restriction endonuclease subunit S [Novipirellula artificiosorum]|uniref:Type-1 restriction enzyme EcoKI specificity protein n=1 Tax=Novipirellula artificiosorum TaxID=2528016 RepID=A0A5C6DZ03_9BACT|nr:restriction endonuclease subunit S [Novipirellula artificiosorum]TWU41880.1 Type-1 restriction enzyme EcoKI specificity protein [Novipirellula artificiosorum]
MNVIKRPISEVVDVNPRIPTEIASDIKRKVDFVPMAQLSEQGDVTPNGSRHLGDVMKGYTYFENGDVIVAKITPCMENGKAAFVDNLPHQIGFGSTEFHVLRPSDSVDGRYLFYMVWNSKFRNEAEGNMTGSAGQKRVPKAFFDRFVIPLPPLSEQKRIADILDKADAIRRKRRDAISQAETILRSAYSQIFGDPVANPQNWPVEDLGSIADIVTGYAFKSAEYVDKGVRLCRGANVMPDTISWADVRYWRPEDKSVDTKLHLAEGDVVLAMDRPWISSGIKVAQVTQADLPTYLVQRVTRLRGDDSVSNAFLYQTIRHPAFTAHCGGLKTETTIPHISSADIKSFQVPVAPKELHGRFETLAQKTQADVKKLTVAAEEADDLFHSLVQCAFKGQL